MNKQAKNYTNDELDLLSGQIRGTSYVDEVQAVLVANGKVYSNGYITRVFNRFSYNNDIWDAIKAVGIARKKLRKTNASEVKELAQVE